MTGTLQCRMNRQREGRKVFQPWNHRRYTWQMGTQRMIQGAGVRRAQRDGKGGQQRAGVGLRRTPRMEMS